MKTYGVSIILSGRDYSNVRLLASDLRKRVIRKIARRGSDAQFWIVFKSTAADNAGLMDHLKSLRKKLPKKLWEPGYIPEDVETYLDIGVFFDTPMCSVEIPYLPDVFDGLPLNLEVSCYPSVFESSL